MITDLSITFLGTGTSQGIPVIGNDHPVCLSEDPKDKRLRTSALIRCNQRYMVIDCGPDFRQQLLNNPIPRLDALLLTHEHADHTHGIDDLRPFFFRQGKLRVYATRKVFSSLERRFDYIFDRSENRYPGAPEVDSREIVPEMPFHVDDIEVIPVEGQHHRITVLGFRIGPLAYLTDIKSLKNKEKDKLKDLEVLVLSALRKDPHPSHLSLDEAVELACSIGARRTYFTHISHLMGFHEETEASLPQGIFLAYDNLQLQVI